MTALLRCGERAVLAETAGLAEAMDLHARLAAARLPGVEELVPAARTVLIRFDPSRTSPDVLAAALDTLPAASGREVSGDLVEIPVTYDGADLAEVAELTGLTPAEVAARHAAAEYTVAFCGFSPGFGYLTGGDPALDVPRLATPRTKVPAGSVAIAEAFTGVYPRELPGGWRILGTTTAVLWDLDRDPPGLLVPGTRVRFG
ncbi:MAG: Allophanate hydrolase subunit 1 [Actinomycetia bacterium]|nr:Allophanate hydrolase subunit 1 [Actinomycetes bacterium]